MSVFAGHNTRYGILYPLQTLSKGVETVFNKVPLLVEANSETDLELTEDIASSLSARVSRVTSEQRAALHLAAVFACNFSNHMYALADDILTHHGLSIELLLPLIDETAAKIHRTRPIDGQTGPAIRGDNATIERHLSLLDNPLLKDIYRQLSDSIQALTTQKY